MKSLLQRFRAMPRSARWLAVFAVGVLAYFFIAEPGIDFFVKQRTRGDGALAALTRYAGADDAFRAAGDTALLGVRHFGEVEYPADPESRSLTFNTVVDDILRKHGITGQTSTNRQTPLGAGGPLVKKVGNDVRVERLTKVLEFEAEPDVLSRILADLEQQPIVATISNLQIRQNEGRDRTSQNVSVSLTVEAWALVRKERDRTR